jgi:hypothetical protein
LLPASLISIEDLKDGIMLSPNFRAAEINTFTATGGMWRQVFFWGR